MLNYLDYWNDKINAVYQTKTNLSVDDKGPNEVTLCAPSPTIPSISDRIQQLQDAKKDLLSYGAEGHGCPGCPGFKK